MNQTTLHALHVLLNAIDFLAWFAACGLLLARAGLMPVASFSLERVGASWWRGLMASLAALAASGIAILIARTMEMGGFSFWQGVSALPAVLRNTHFGHVWALHLTIVALLFFGFWISRAVVVPAAVGWILVLCGTATLALSYSAVSHAGDGGDFTVAEFNDGIHLVAVSAWGGAILATWFFAFHVLARARELLTVTVYRLSAVSAAALAIVLVTGLYNTWLRITDISDLTRTDYGRVLAIKLALVATMTLLGACNRFLIIPCLQHATAEDETDRQLKRIAHVLAVDVLLVMLIVFAAALLIQGMPPSSSMGAMHRM